MLITKKSAFTGIEHTLEIPVTQEQLDLDRQKYPLKRYGRPEEVAYAVIYLLSEASAWTTGTNILLDGGRTTSY